MHPFVWYTSCDEYRLSLPLGSVTRPLHRQAASVVIGEGLEVISCYAHFVSRAANFTTQIMDIFVNMTRDTCLPAEENLFISSIVCKYGE